MKKSNIYTVAGHSFAVAVPEEFPRYQCPGNYAPFLDNEEDGVEDGEKDLLFCLDVAPVGDLADVRRGSVKELLNEEAPYFWIFEDGGGDGRFSFGFSRSKSGPDCILCTSADFSRATVYVPESCCAELAGFAIDNSLMLLYTFRSAPYGTLLLHASVVGYADGGYMFLGRSGTGKSTHSRLWLKNFADAYLLNDDNPVVRAEDGRVNVYGSPWSGKTPCYKNAVLPLRAAVRLSQAPHNRIERLSPVSSYASLLPSCSCMRWDSAAMSDLHAALEKIISSVPCWHLECLPDDDAAMVCRDAITCDVRS